MHRAFAMALLATACSAPTTAPPGSSSVGAPPPEPDTPAVHAPPPPEPSRPRAPAAPLGPSPAVVPTPAARMPGAPFTAWTTTAPLTLVAPGGRPVATLRRLGVRVEVEQVLESRLRVRCTGCTGDAQDAEGWLQPGNLRAARTGGQDHDPLIGGLKRRAGWAGRRDLPPDAEPAALCALVDHGFTLDGAVATWEHAGGRLVLSWDDGAWSQTTLAAPTLEGGWPCQARGGTPP
jgi:hypothetical protein